MEYNASCSAPFATYTTFAATFFPTTNQGFGAPPILARCPTVYDANPRCGAAPGTGRAVSASTNAPSLGVMYSPINSPNGLRPMKQIPALERLSAQSNPRIRAASRVSDLNTAPSGKHALRNASPRTDAKKYD